MRAACVVPSRVKVIPRPGKAARKSAGRLASARYEAQASGDIDLYQIGVDCGHPAVNADLDIEITPDGHRSARACYRDVGSAHGSTRPERVAGLYSERRHQESREDKESRGSRPSDGRSSSHAEPGLWNLGAPNLLGIQLFQGPKVPLFQDLPHPLEHRGDALAAADAEADEPVAGLPPLELVHELDSEDGTGRAHGVPQGDGAAAGVRALDIQT